MDSTIFAEYATDLDSLVQGIVDKLEGGASKLKGGSLRSPDSQRTWTDSSLRRHRGEECSLSEDREGARGSG